MAKYVIIGVSSAGIACAKAIRANDSDGEIVMISEDVRVYARSMLGKLLSHEKSLDGLSFIPRDFFQKNNITWISGQSVTAVMTDIRAVKTDKQDISFDKLCIATGCESFIPPIENLRTAQNVFGLRHAEDVAAIDSVAMPGSCAVIIGAGLVGLDAAFALIGRGVSVTVAELANRVLSVQLDEKTAGEYQALFEAAGVSFRLGVKAVKAHVDAMGGISGIELEGGDILPCDFAVAAVGVRSRTAFLEGSGISVNKGITVDEHMATNISGIYAAGDVTGLSGVWPDAMKQGDTAGKCMSGGDAEYKQGKIVNIINYYGKSYTS